MADQQTVAVVAAVAQKSVELAVPVLLPFDPLITLIRSVIMAHFNAVGTFPTDAQIIAALPTDWQTLKTTWAAWKPSGDGTLSR